MAETNTSVDHSSLALPAHAVPTFLEEVVAATPGESHLAMCIQCGTCGGSCPSAADMDHTPRQLFAMIRAGMRHEVLKSNAPWFCVSCYYCSVRCPQDIHITDTMYTLKRMAVAAKSYDDAAAPDFSKTFIAWVENNGRAFELGLMGLHTMRHNLTSVLRLAPMGLGMVTKGRMDFMPRRIKGIKGLQAILAKAKDLEAQR